MNASTIKYSIEVIEVTGEWFVLVREDGHESFRSFETEAFALSYSDRQRLRLGLDKIVCL